MLDMISAGQKRVDQILSGIDEDISKNSPTLKAVTSQHLQARDGSIRARAALQLLCSAMGPHDAEASVALAVSCELTYISNKIHNEVYYLDEFSLRAGAAHLRILAGDYLFSISSAYVAQSNNIAAMKAAIGSLARVSEASLSLTYDHLYQRLINGYDYKSYDRDIRGRVGSIFQAAAETGSILANLPPEMADALYEYSQQISLVCQLAKTQSQLKQRGVGWHNLPADAAEVVLVFYNELRANQPQLSPLPQASDPTDSAKALADAVQLVSPHHLQIMNLVEMQKQNHVERALAHIPTAASDDCGRGLAELAEIVSQNRSN